MPDQRDPLTAEILLVEDSQTDVIFVREALSRSNISHELHVVQDGTDALAFLRQEGQYVEAPRPDLILLDLNLITTHGHEVLAELKSDDDLKRIQVVVLTSSQAEEDVLKSYNLHASGFITKPSNLNELEGLMEQINAFWFRAVILPPK